jgi:hypothetical protein
MNDAQHIARMHSDALNIVESNLAPGTPEFRELLASVSSLHADARAALQRGDQRAASLATELVNLARETVTQAMVATCDEALRPHMTVVFDSTGLGILTSAAR